MELLNNPIQACNDIFFKPNRVFYKLKEKHNWSWVPFIIVMALAMLPSYLYMNFVDFDWYANLILESQMGDVSPAERDAFKGQFTSSSALTFSLVGVFFGLVIINAIYAAYLHFMTRNDEQNVQGYTDWYGFSWWIAMPLVINSVVSILLILLASDHQLTPNVLAPLSLGYLFNVEIGSSWSGLAGALRLDTLWGLYIAIVGITQWTSFDTKKAAIIVILPSLVIYSVWLLFTVLN